MTDEEHLAYIDCQIEACRRATGDESLPLVERLGAQLGEVDWLVAKQMADEKKHN